MEDIISVKSSTKLEQSQLVITAKQNGLAVVFARKRHNLPITCVKFHPSDESVAYSASKDGFIFKWDLTTGKVIERSDKVKNKAKIIKTREHTNNLYCIDISEDGKYLASGGSDSIIRIYDASTLKYLDMFTGHRDAITGLVFRKNTTQLYSCSKDRLIKIWNVDGMLYIESLYGHQSSVIDIDSSFLEKPISCGEDGTLRLWKIVQESQLIFSGGKIEFLSIDCIRLLDSSYFISGGQDGNICIWSTDKKTPRKILENVHGGCWINALATNRHGMVVSGSSDGYLNVWEFKKNIIDDEFGYSKQTKDKDDVTLNLIKKIPLDGYINSLAMDKSGKFVVAGIGYEPRLGSWERKKVKNNFVLSQL